MTGVDTTTKSRSADLGRKFPLFAAIALFSQAAIAVTGATVRLTGSGLGCSDWPTCEPGRFVAPWEFHAQIEFINRLFTGLVSLSAGAALVVALMMRPRVNTFVRLSAILVGGIFAQALVGAMVTKSDLLPNWVAVHYLLSAILVAVATVLWDRSTQHHARSVGKTAPRRPTTISPLFERALAFTAVVVLVSGPIVTGSGPHAGDELAHRWGFDLGSITRFHSASVWLFVAVIIWGLVSTRGSQSSTGPDGVSARRIRNLALISVLQGAIGYIQYFTQLPPALVGAHVAGSMLVVVAVTMVLHRGSADVAPAASNDARSVAPMPVAATEGT